MSEVIVVKGRGEKNMEDVGDNQASTSGGDIEMQVPYINKPFVDAVRNRFNKITEEEIQSRESSSSVCIFRVPQSFREINYKEAIDPEMVSIGPFHHGKEEVSAFENYKWQFLRSLLSLPQVRGVEYLYYAMTLLEKEARSYYSEPIQMLSADFCQMMVLDGCFIVELFRQFHLHLANATQPFFRKEWLIPILFRDLLKLENQLPLFVLQKIYDITIGRNYDDPHRRLLSDENNISFSAIKFFRRALLIPPSSPDRTPILGCYHLLHLFHSWYSPSTSHPLSPLYPPLPNPCVTLLRSAAVKFRPLRSIILNFLERNFPWRNFSWDSRSTSHPLSNQSMPCVTLLRSAGVKFRPPKSNTIDNFLEINFHQGVLKIPPITINDFTSTVLINCAALEQCLRHIMCTHFSTYIAFMSCLINSGGDVSFLCEDGIITNYSYNDLRISLIFKKLGAIAAHNVGDHLYLSEQFRGVDAYYRSHWATLRRRYFSNPWTSISVVTASILLVLTAISAIMSVLSYTVHHSKLQELATYKLLLFDFLLSVPKFALLLHLSSSSQ